MNTTVQKAIERQREKQDGRRWKSLEIPIPTERWPVLTARFPMPQKEWDELMGMLEIMKPAIIDETNEKKTPSQQ